MLPWIIVLLIVAAGCIGAVVGFMLTVAYGGRIAHEYADWRAENCPNCTAAEDESGRIDDRTNAWLDEVQTRAERLCRCDDEQCIADARKLADEDVPELVAEVRRLACRNFNLEHGAAETGDANPCANLTVHDVDPDAAHATADNDYDDERAEGADQDGATV